MSNFNEWKAKQTREPFHIHKHKFLSWSLGRALPYLGLLMMLVFVLSFVLMPAGYDTPHGPELSYMDDGTVVGGLQEIHVLKPWVSKTQWVGGLFLSVVMLIWSVVEIRRYRVVPLLIWLFLVLMVSPVALGYAWLELNMGWHKMNEIKASDGRNYQVFVISFLQGYSECLTTRAPDHDGWFYQSYEMVGKRQSDWRPRLPRYFIRPAGHDQADQSFQMYETKDGALIVLTHMGFITQYYHLNHETYLSSDMNMEQKLEVEGLNPYVLMDQTSLPQQADFQTMIEGYEREIDIIVNYDQEPERLAVLANDPDLYQGVKHINPEVSRGMKKVYEAVMMAINKAQSPMQPQKPRTQPSNTDQKSNVAE